MKFSPVLGFYKTRENEKKTISSLEKRCNNLQKELESKNEKNTISSLEQRCNNLEKEIESKNEDIRLLRELVQKQYLEIKKIKSSYKSHKTIHLF